MQLFQVNLRKNGQRDRHLPFFQQITDRLINENAANEGALKQLSVSLNLLIKIFHDLNCQDLPEFFEDNMQFFMEQFQKYLIYGNVLLESQDEDEAGPLEKIKTSICEVLELYTQKYLEDFHMLNTFVPIVFDLLASRGHEAKNDTLVCKGLSLLTCMVKTENVSSALLAGDTLKSMCEKIALPNIAMRESDEELFEDNPIEYIRRDLEGSDTDTRRRAAADFIRGLMERLEAQVTEIMSQYIQHYLQRYAASPQDHWKDKNTAIFLLVAIAARSSTASYGVTKTNSLVNIVDFFSQNVVVDLQSGPNEGNPILKVDAIKYLYTFRSQLNKDQLLSVFPLLVKHLESTNYVVHTYSAIAIERVLFIREGKNMLFTSGDVAPYAETLLSQLFNLIEAGQTPEKLSENDYLMKTVMRVIITCRQDMVTYVNVIMGKLTSILAVSEFENLVFGPFQVILAQDIQEFKPYVFQLMAQLLEQHKGQDLSEAYTSLLNPILQPQVWDPANTPALVRLVQAYLSKGINTLLTQNKLEPILGIFQQKLINSRHNDFYAIQLLSSITKYVPSNFTRSFTQWICLFCVLDSQGGPDNLIRVFENIQPGLFGQIITLFVVPDLNALREPVDYKTCSIGIARLLTESQLLLEGAYAAQVWPKVFTGLLGMLELPPNTNEDGPDEFYLLDLEETGYQATYARLFTSSPVREDPTASYPACQVYLVQQLVSMPHEKRTLIKSLLPPEANQFLPKYFEAAGVPMDRL
ncbi:Cse1-domain-containing protein [Syncephalastrum racemosum]|uniref:Cse1-domain-containing protein n=1 Tax=Syncephalastrum racemosum TaxID=13706 RepID=A0A1X2HNB9_SYNRA|nr:Cse1-domain-containing protein [Syncephalastrum racemosum]